MNYDRIELTPELSEGEIITTVKINSKVINWFADYTAFLNSSHDNRTWWQKEENLQRDKGSDFYPFNCSCGEPGCAGIWDGIYSKHRARTVEWRIPKDSGYEFLDKPFYRFSRGLYDAELKVLWDFLLENKDEKLVDYFNEPRHTIQNIMKYLTNPYER